MIKLVSIAAISVASVCAVTLPSNMRHAATDFDLIYIADDGAAYIADHGLTGGDCIAALIVAHSPAFSCALAPSLAFQSVGVM